jgi:hypothetical protein
VDFFAPGSFLGECKKSAKPLLLSGLIQNIQHANPGKLTKIDGAFAFDQDHIEA